MPQVRIPPLHPENNYIPPISDETKLASAIIQEKISDIRSLISSNPRLANYDLGAKYNHLTPISLAATLLKADAIRVLLELGADPNFATPLSIPALPAAVSMTKDQATTEMTIKMAEVFSILINHAKAKGPEALKQMTDWRSSDGATILCMLAQEGFFIPSLILLNAAPWLLNETRDLGETPLHLALCYGHIGAAEFFLDAGTDVNIADIAMVTPLATAIKYNFPSEMIKKILKKSSKAIATLTDRAGHTPLMLACALVSEENIDIIPALLSYDPDTTRINSNNMAAISCAVISGSLEVIKRLRHCPKPDPKLIIPPHFHLVLSPKSDESQFRKMLAELTEQGYSIDASPYTISVTMIVNEIGLSRCRILEREMNADLIVIPKENGTYKIILSTISNADEYSLENEIEWVASAKGATIKSESDRMESTIVSEFHRMFNKYSHSLDENEDTKEYKKAINQVMFNISAVIDDYNIKEFLEDTYFYYFFESSKQKCIKNSLFNRDNDFFTATIKIFTAIYRNKYETEDHLFSIYFLQYCYFYLKTNIEEDPPFNSDRLIDIFDIACEVFNSSLDSMIHLGSVVEYILKRISDKYINTSQIKKLSESIKKALNKITTDPEKNELGHLKILFVLKNYLIILNEYFISIKYSNNYILAIGAAYELLENLKVYNEALEKIGKDYIDYEKIKTEIDELSFEYHYQLSKDLGKLPEKHEEQLKHIMEAVRLYGKRNNSWISYPDLKSKRKKLIKLKKDVLNALKKSQENEEEAEDSRNDAAPEPAQPATDPSISLVMPAVSLNNVNTKMARQKTEEDRLREKLAREKEKKLLERKALKLQASRTEIENKNSKTDVQPKWTEEQIKSLFKSLLTADDKLKVLDHPGNAPPGTYWAIFRISKDDFPNPKEYNFFAGKFNEGRVRNRVKDNGITLGNGHYYIRGARRGPRIQGRCHQIPSGPFLIIFDTKGVVSHEEHENLIETEGKILPVPLAYAFNITSRSSPA